MPNLSPFDNPAQFVVLEPGRPRLLVGTMGQVAVEVVVVADGFGNGQVQHVVLRIAPVGFGQSVLCVLFFGWYFPLVLADDLAVAVVVEAGNALAVGGADEVAVQVVLVSGFLNLVVVAGEGMDQPAQYIAFELGGP